MAPQDGLLHDGPVRYRTVICPEIESAVRVEFAGRLAQASWLERLRLRVVIHREVRRRINIAIPNRALF